MRYPGGAKIALECRRQRALVAEHDGQKYGVVGRRQKARHRGAQILPPALQYARHTITVGSAQQVQPFRPRDAAHRVNAPPLHQAAKIERSRIARGARAMQPQPVHP